MKPKFTIIPNDIIDRMAELGAVPFAVYVVLAKHADQKGRCWPSEGAIGKIIGRDSRTVRRALRALEHAGLVEQQRRGRGATAVYTLIQDRTPMSALNAKTGHPCPPRPDTGDRKTGHPCPVQGNKTQEQDPKNKTQKARASNHSKKSSSPPAGGTAVPIPEPLGTPEFTTAWREWLGYRKERKLTCTTATLTRQLCKLADLSPLAAIAEIENSIGNGWHSLCYGDRRNGNGKPSTPGSRPGRVEPDAETLAYLEGLDK